MNPNRGWSGRPRTAPQELQCERNTTAVRGGGGRPVPLLLRLGGRQRDEFHSRWPVPPRDPQKAIREEHIAGGRVAQLLPDSPACGGALVHRRSAEKFFNLCACVMPCFPGFSP